MKKYLFVLLFLSSTLSALDPTIILFGPPGSGKGTFSQHLKEQYGYNHVSAGDLVRAEIDKKTPIGLEIADIVRRGDYIDKPVMYALIKKRIMELKAEQKPFIIDGFGRSKEDVQFLHALLQELDLLPVTFAIFLDADDTACAARISERLVCPTCGHVYNHKAAPPSSQGVCDVCKGELKSRINDTQEVIQKRLADYKRIREESFAPAQNLFVYMHISTNRPLHECLSDYSELALKIKAFPGGAAEFIRLTDSISAKHPQ